MDFCRISESVILGRDVSIHAFVNLYGCTIGDGSKIGAFVEIQKNATIGAHCKVSSHTFICEGVSIGNGVFVGHSVTFINDKYPHAVNAEGILQDEDDWQVVSTSIGDRVSIGSGTTIMCGVSIGAGAMIGAGSLVLSDIPGNELWAGNPAVFIRRL